MNKKYFKKFSEDCPELPFSLKYSWWDEVVKDNWEVAVVENQGQVQAFWPYSIRKRGGFTLLGQPAITPYCGPYIIYPEGQKKPTKYSYEKKMMEKLLHQFPQYDQFEQNCNFQLQNYLPLIWKGFQQTNRYTYILSLISGIDKIYSGFADNVRREIKKAEKTIEVVESSDIAPIIELVQSSFEAQFKEIPIPNSTFQSFHQYIQKHNCGKILYARDKNNRFIAGIGIIWDKHSAYYLLGGADKEHKSSGAMSLLMWKAIQYSKTQVPQFNFEGSMNPQIERFLRGFGGELTNYSRIVHQKSGLLRLTKSFLNKS